MSRPFWRPSPACLQPLARSEARALPGTPRLVGSRSAPADATSSARPPLAWLSSSLPVIARPTQGRPWRDVDVHGGRRDDRNDGSKPRCATTRSTCRRGSSSCTFPKSAPVRSESRSMARGITPAWARPRRSAFPVSEQPKSRPELWWPSRASFQSPARRCSHQG
jgi:hypothetical protein